MVKNCLVFVTLLWSFTSVFGQERTIYAKWTDQEIFLDGKLDEGIWSEAVPATGFWQHFPTDSLQADAQTEVRILQHEKFLYLGIIAHAQGEKYIIPSLKRDFRASGNDNVTFLFDTFNDATNSFFFGTNPEGVQREGLIAGGGIDFSDFSTTWDIKWNTVSKKEDGFYVIEVRIPFSSFKFKAGVDRWRFNSYRFDTHSNQWSTWSNIPQNQTITNMAFMGELIFERPLGVSKTPISLIPFVSGNVTRDYNVDETSTDLSFGGDAKIPIGNSLNLDLTVNPDFSQVEADELVVNLTRFEVFLPEKRQFFIDNADLFANFGNGRSANPFFSRRIGIAKDLDGTTIENNILGGARLSGKLNENLRLGFLNMQTAEDQANEIPTNNNTVIALQQQVFKTSNIGFVFVNRQVTKSTDFIEDADKYNRIVGLDFNLQTEENKWTGKYYLHKSFSPDSGEKDFSSGGFLQYNSRFWKFNLGGTYVGEDFRADLGFVRRNDILTVDPVATRVFYPVGSRVNTHTIELRGSSTWSPELDLLHTDAMVDLEYQIQFKNQTNIEMALNHRYTYLLDEFDPTGSDDGIPLPAFSDYNYTKFDFSYQSDRRKVFYFRARTDLGQFFNGNRYSLSANFNYRLQPYFTASISSSVNYIDLPDPYPTESLWFVGPNFEFTFTKNLFWSTLVQYNSQGNDFGINSRLQWRWKPLSDLYVVYNDNYKTNPLSPGVRAVIMKFTYWINI
jgi:hypothetical protein